MSKNNGSMAAFPHNEIHDQMAPYRHFEAQPGMTLREYFAAKAMQSILAHADWSDPECSAVSMAGDSCKMADALLAELAK